MHRRLRYSEWNKHPRAVVLIIEPIGVTKCLANGQSVEVDKGRLKVVLEAVDAVQARSAVPKINHDLSLSKISAQVNQSFEERLLKL
jgi:hypothetical protein